MGAEYFHFSATRRLLRFAKQHADLVHCHNLHGNYFDLRSLPRLADSVPVVLTLHDAWLLSGHCAHSFACELWTTGCGHCPDLTIYPAIPRDATAHNWRTKQDLYARSRLYVATPCHWLMGRVAQSMLRPGIAESRVIPYGVDLGVFRPSPKRLVRKTLGLPPDAAILVFAANGIRRSVWKDYRTMRYAVAKVAERMPGTDIVFLAVGEDAPVERVGRAQIRFVPFQRDANRVADYYRAADLYLHAARADTFPNTVLESLACGTPVVATAVGGIPEQVKSIADCGLGIADCHTYGPHEATGILTPPADAGAMAEAVITLLTDEPLRRQLGVNAARDARQRFDLERQVDDYLGWYGEVIEDWAEWRAKGRQSQP
jgi:glycosyltransferase involved in cell wall biosynthesis